MPRPEFFGPRFWDVLFLSAFRLDEKPTEEEVERYAAWFNLTINFILPCDACRTNSRVHFETLGSIKESARGGPLKVLGFMYDFKDMVNKTLGKTSPSKEAVIKYWVSQ